jgi:ring-1,2-phenylacetyl-CoA epoxidase subunit PaaD
VSTWPQNDPLDQLGGLDVLERQILEGERPDAWEVASQVPDPEMPVLTIAELGILRDVCADDQGRVHVMVTPTYSGYPAMEAIRDELVDRLTRAGFRQVDVEFVLSPAWTTDWITDEAKAKLTAYGIAPPGPADGPVSLTLSARCPQCGSLDTREISRFGATACKSLWVCQSCREPFDHVKAI